MIKIFLTNSINSHSGMSLSAIRLFTRRINLSKALDPEYSPGQFKKRLPKDLIEGEVHEKRKRWHENRNIDNQIENHVIISPKLRIDCKHSRVVIHIVEDIKH